MANKLLSKDMQFIIELIESGRSEGATSYLRLAESIYYDEVLRIKRFFLDPMNVISRHKMFTFKELISMGAKSRLAVSSEHVKYEFDKEARNTPKFWIHHAKHATRRAALGFVTHVKDESGAAMTIAELYLKAIELDNNCADAWVSLAKLTFRNDSLSQPPENDGWNITLLNFRTEYPIVRSNAATKGAAVESVQIANFVWRLDNYLSDEQRSYANYLKYYHRLFVREERWSLRASLSWEDCEALEPPSFPTYLPAKSSRKKKKRQTRVTFQLETTRSTPDLYGSGSISNSRGSRSAKNKAKHFDGAPSLQRVRSMI